MLLSVITVNYNNKEGLINTAKSIVNQTNSCYEWIVIDGGSDDGSFEVIKQYSDRLAYWCSEKDAGVYDAMNKGVGIAKGDFVIFMNSGDMFASEDVVEKFAEQDLESDIIYGDVVYVKPEGNQKIVYPDVLPYDRFPKSTINHQSTFIRRSLAERFPYDMNYRLAADRKFWVQALYSGAVFAHMNYVVALYDYTGMSSVQSVAVEDECKRIYKEVVPVGMRMILDELEEKRFISAYNPELEQVYNLINKRRLYRRIIQFVIKVLQHF